MGKRRRGNQETTSLTKKQKKHLKEFGEQHPFHDNVVDRPAKTQILRLPDSPQHPEPDSEGDSDEEQQSAYQKLLTTMIQGADDNSEDEESEDEDDGEEVEGESEEEEEEEEEEEGSDAEEDLEEEEGETPDKSQNKEHPDKTNGDTEETEEVEMEGEFTDKKNEAAFCLETNLPAEGEENMREEEDIFAKHQETELSEEEVGRILQGSKIKTQVKWPKLGTLQCTCPLERFPALGPPSSAPFPTIHKTLEANWCLLNKSFAPEGGAVTDITELQKELLGLMGTYRDVHFTNSSPLREAKEVRSAYCLHVLNHVLKANTRVLRNNAKLKETKDVNEEFRDQGITRPKVLILVPFRDGVLRVVQTFITLLEPKGKKMDVSNKKRFKEEYGEEPGESPPKLQRPDDYHAIFSGNTDDHFRIGVSIMKRSMRLYSPFYSSDIIIASPLGLRTVLGTDGEKKRDFDFLSSIELLIVDQADVFLMQNWEHLLHVLKCLNLQPLDSHGVDFSRVRMWNLNNWAANYRQTLVFSAIQEPQITNILTKHCHNYRGQVCSKTIPKVGSICQVLVQLPHVFQMFHSDSLMDQDARFQFFVDKILPQYRDSVMSHTFIYVPSYFDFVRLRNYLKKEDVSFASVSEYSQRSEVSRARHYFQKGEKQFMLFSERFHFYKRYTIKGIHNLIFYGLPTYPHFYSEVCNMLQAGVREGGGSVSFTCTALYSRYDMHRLAAITGVDRAAQMLQSKKSVHLFITGEEKNT
ncbi:U3 small nucleolar RNA-associated protein 25 homolog isoform X1 [Carassius gibelio]|uniref:U3 small nucleolar RNA-associated protein 25 homolog isoform X1 n=2 Tax=Carassius gibelio TaxID=101364 RepID=UPI0022786EB4|nr:U3 small nucleolar RNA-associated protein 25 homolog isoform X1 [Carassius gibelio]